MIRFTPLGKNPPAVAVGRAILLRDANVVLWRGALGGNQEETQSVSTILAGRVTRTAMKSRCWAHIAV